MKVLLLLQLGIIRKKGIIKGTIDNAQEENKAPLENKLNIIAGFIEYFF
jgi:hypothetical protein